MDQDRTPPDRYEVSIPVTLRVCASEDDTTPLTHPVEAVVDDVSSGGARFDIPNVPSEYVHLFQRGGILSAEFDPKRVKVTGRVLLKIAWYRSRSGSRFSRSAVGAFFSKISETDRAALLKYGQDHATAVKVSKSKSLSPWWAIAALGLFAVVGLVQSFSVQRQLEAASRGLADVTSTLRQNATSQDEQNQTLLSALNRAMARSAEGRAADVDGRAAYATSSAEGRAGDGRAVHATSDGISPPADPPVREVRPPVVAKPKLKFELASRPKDIEVISLEFLQGDFVGAVRNKRSTDISMTVIVEYTCDGPNSPACKCKASLRIAHGGAEEFACSPASAPKVTNGEIEARLQLHPAVPGVDR